jgi:GNAT superfamily N-acetyltransferase
MIEVRSINESEAVSFLQIVCEVFDLDFARARTVFYNEPMFDLDRKWALFEDGQMLSVLTSVPLIFGWGRAVGIASVATRPAARNRGLATELLHTVLDRSRERGEDAAYLFARDPSMYVRMGFEPLDEMVRVPLPSQAEPTLAEPLPQAEIQRLYAAWEAQDDNRLRRDDLRWRAWRWGMRAALPSPSGYVCVEGSVVREVVGDPPPEWPVGQLTDWIGLRSMTRLMGLETGPRQAYLLAKGTDRKPQMFLTDQF